MGATLAELKEREDKCPERYGKRYGDEVYYFCSINDRHCLREYGSKCYIYDDFIKEREDGNN